MYHRQINRKNQSMLSLTGGVSDVMCGEDVCKSKTNDEGCREGRILQHLFTLVFLLCVVSLSFHQHVPEPNALCLCIRRSCEMHVHDKEMASNYIEAALQIIF